ncbi:sigma factor-like helix-turn-helix DNA-binding protein [Streptomyces sp. 3N207]|uniref:sigma factor-like helix-turn-helix DNA-binding protein n=1 Tax=Streptomyces sp. 3N207 TaxID=3457417 RepID=UPI003FD30F2F
MGDPPRPPSGQLRVVGRDDGGDALAARTPWRAGAAGSGLPKEVDGTAWLDDVLADTDDIDRVLSSLVLVKAFRTLSPAHREVLYETYCTGRSTREVSLVLGIPPGTVKSRLYHAVRKLRQALGVTEVADGKLVSTAR